MVIRAQPPLLAAIDVGTNAVRLHMARVEPDGSLETVHQERDAVRPGEGLFLTGRMPRPVEDRLLATLRRYGALCRRHGAKVRAVATSALREAKNRDAILARVRREAGLELEVVSGKEEARLICLGVLAGKPANARSLCLDIGGGSTELAVARGERPTGLWSVAIGAVRTTELFRSDGDMTPGKLRLMREYAEETAGETLPAHVVGAPRIALGSSGTIQAVVSYASKDGTPRATAREIRRAVDKLAAMSPAKRRKRFDARRADIVVAGAVILEAVVERVGIEAVVAVDRGLRDGLLVDLIDRARPRAPGDHSLEEAACALGRRFGFDEAHGQQVATIALALFDQLAGLHGLPASARPFLQVAALLHDVGNAVSYGKHHRHTYYLIANADIPGLADRERELVARIARFHRRSPPSPEHEAMQGLSAAEARLVTKLSVLLRVADSLDRSHHRPVRGVRASVAGTTATVRLVPRGVVDLELWDAEREAALFHQVFGKRLRVEVAPRTR